MLDFSVWIRTGSKPKYIKIFNSHTGKTFKWFYFLMLITLLTFNDTKVMSKFHNLTYNISQMYDFKY